MKLSLLLLLAFLSANIFGQQCKPVDDKSEIKFSIKNFGINTSGTFSGLSGNINFDTSHLSASSFNISVDVNTINTGVDMRDNHLKKDEYFNAVKFPKIIFTSTEIKTTSNGYSITGTLSIKGTTKNITFPFIVTKQGTGMLFAGSFNINRRDFDVGSGSAVLGNNVDVNLKVFAQ